MSANVGLFALHRVKLQRETVNDDCVVVTRLFALDGATIQNGQPVLEVESSKSSSEIVSPADGRLSIRAQVGDELKIGDVIFEILPLGVESSTPKSDMQGPSQALDGDRSKERLAGAAVLSSAARRIAEVYGISHACFAAGQWVTEADVVALAQRADRGSVGPVARAVGAHSDDGAIKRREAAVVLQEFTPR
jgi:pyruvate/2-oxoglutarate dehydrogenase complex dihydrolipoamide acyltransferase (E2) component